MGTDGKFWMNATKVLGECLSMDTHPDNPNFTRDLAESYKAIESNVGEDGLGAHPILRALRDRKQHETGRGVAAADLRPLFQLDPGQAAAVAEALSGRPITVIDGPPGCGKSQVVAALMYECWVRDKSALFVSATNLAVDVVKDRLRAVAGEELLVARHGSRGRSDVVDLSEHWRKLRELGSGERISRLSAFPAPADTDRDDRIALRDLQKQLESYAPDAINELMQIVINAASRARDDRAATEQEDQTHRIACTIGTLHPRDPADAQRFVAACRGWIDGFIDLREKIEQVRQERTKRATRARELRREALCHAIIESPAHFETIEPSALLEVSRKFGEFRLQLARLRDESAFACEPRQWPVRPPREDLSIELRLHEVEECREQLRRVLRSEEWKGRRASIEAESFYAQLCSRLKVKVLPRRCIQEDFRAELSRRLMIVRQARLQLDESSRSPALARVMPWSRWNASRKSLDQSVMDLRKLLLSIGSAVDPAAGLDGDGASILVDLGQALLDAPVIEQRCLLLDRLRANLKQIFADAERLGARGDLVGMTDVGLRSLESQLSELWEVERVRLARELFARAAKWANGLASLVREHGMRAESVLSAEMMLKSLSDGKTAEVDVISELLRGIESSIEHVLGLVKSAGLEEDRMRAIAMPDMLYREWLNRRPDLPGDAAGVPSIDDSPALTDQYRQRLATIARHVEAWEACRQERATARVGVERMVDDGHRKLSEIRALVPLDIRCGLDEATRAPSVADWDTEKIGALLATVTPRYLEQQRKAIYARIRQRERDWIAKALKGAVGREERDALDWLGRDATRKTDDGEYATRFSRSLRALPLIVTTTRKMHDRIPMKSCLFDLVIVDEASATRLLDAFPSIVRAKSLVVIGDPNQLPPVRSSNRPVFEESCARCGVDPLHLQCLGDPLASLYDFASRISRNGGVEPVTLKNHYRSHPAIIGFANKEIYRRSLTLKRHPEPGDPQSPAGVFSMDIRGSPVAEKGSRFNQEQAVEIADRIRALRAADPRADIGVVTPYTAQAERIKGCLENVRLQGHQDILVGTVHKFQGSERDHIIFNPPNDMSDFDVSNFIDDRMVNVAVTRARKSLTIVADIQAMKSRVGLLRHLADFAELCGRLRRTSRGGHELFCWMLLEGIECEGDPECFIADQQVTFRVRDETGALRTILVAPSARSATLALADDPSSISFLSKDIMRSPRGAAKRLRDFLRGH
jgi:hypothetical protein